jgi:hypothetical protein
MIVQRSYIKTCCRIDEEHIFPEASSGFIRILKKASSETGFAKTCVHCYTRLLRSFINLKHKPKVIVITPPPLYFADEAARFNLEAPKAVRAIAQNLAFEKFLMYLKLLEESR